jgi:flagellar biosynthetic protein FliP
LKLNGWRKAANFIPWNQSHVELEMDVRSSTRYLPGWAERVGPLAWAMLALIVATCSTQWCAAQIQSQPIPQAEQPLAQSTENWADLGKMAKLERGQVSQWVSSALTISLVGLLPLVGLMATSYVRLVIVLGLLRQALGGTHTPPAQVTTALALFLTILIMSPVLSEIKTTALDPYLAPESPISLEQAIERGAIPLKRFMSQQIIAAKNTNDVWLFYKYLPAEQQKQRPTTFNEVPLQVLLPAFLISELKTAFAIGFQIFLPFLIVDLLVTSITTSMGMIMLPPSTISLPIKLALFVMVDGWHLIVGMLLQSFPAFT